MVTRAKARGEGTQGALASNTMTDIATKTSRNKLTEIGRAAMHVAMRDALLEALARNNWNITRTGREFGLDSPNTHRMIRMLGMADKIKAARVGGSTVDSSQGCG